MKGTQTFVLIIINSNKTVYALIQERLFSETLGAT